MPKRIQRKRTKGWKMPEGAVYVGRPTMWGNPFPSNCDGVAIECIPLGLDGCDAHDRAMAAVDLFRRWLTGGKVNELIACLLPRIERRAPSLRIIQRDLAGRDLACWCSLDQPCHADVLLEIANGATHE